MSTSPSNARALAARIIARLEALSDYPKNWRLSRKARRRRHTRRAGMNDSRRLFAYRRTLLPSELLAEVEREGGDLQTAVAESGLSMGYPAWNLLYYAALCSLGGREADEVVVVETGTNRGFSTIVLAQAIVDAGLNGVVDTVDIDPEVVEIARANVTRAGLADRVRFHVGDSLECLRRLVREREFIDFAFLDGSHEYAHVRAEFAVVFPAVVAAQGLVYFDNTAAGGVAGALRYVRRAYPGSLVELRGCSWSPPGNALWQPE